VQSPSTNRATIGKQSLRGIRIDKFPARAHCCQASLSSSSERVARTSHDRHIPCSAVLGFPWICRKARSMKAYPDIARLAKPGGYAHRVSADFRSRVKTRYRDVTPTQPAAHKAMSDACGRTWFTFERDTKPLSLQAHILQHKEESLLQLGQRRLAWTFSSEE
jgi:hypothetical protein